jgi:hypothetical protein
VRFGPVRLDSIGTVFGLGLDLTGNTLVITDGSAKFGGGAISAQWFSVSGVPLTGEFLLVSNFTPGSNTWFETSALIGGGVMVRRMDLVLETIPTAVTRAKALVTVGSGATFAQPAPAWMTSRPDTRLQITRNGRAYAALPYGAPGVTCAQRVDLLAADGTLCSAATYPIAAGSCNTHDLTLGLDGTVIQQLPGEMETAFQGNVNVNTCTWRWWAGALR